MNIKKILAAIAACAMSAAMISMTVSAAGIDADDDVIADDDIEDDGFEIEDDGEDEAPAETEAPVEQAPVTATNPVTGNSPIALAVIPVALAAAAVVAKKAK